MLLAPRPPSRPGVPLRARLVRGLMLGLALTCAGVALAPVASAAPAPARPGPLTVSTVTQTSAVVDFGRSRGATRYRILANGKAVGLTRSTQVVTVRLACGRLYYVTAQAVDARGRRSAPSPGANLRTRACLDVTKPTRPARLRAVRRSESVVLRWDSSTDPGNGAASGYLVYRDGVVLGGATGTRFVARNLLPATRYTFTVRARDRAGNLSRAQRLPVTTRRPVQSTGDVSAFLLTSDGGSLADAKRHYRRLGRVFPTNFSLTRYGDVQGTGQASLTRWFQERGVSVLPRFHTEDPGTIEALLTNPGTRSDAAARVAAVVGAGGYDGASIDIEMTLPATGVGSLTKDQRWERLRDGYSDFIDELALLLHAEGHQLSVAVSPNWCSGVDPATRQPVYCTDSRSTSTRRPRAYLFDYERIAASADEIWVMSWGLHWASSDSGPVADLGWLRSVVDYYGDLFAQDPQARTKLTLGTNLYGMDWSEKVVRTESIVWPGSSMPLAPSCDGPSRTARARTSFEQSTGSGGTLHIDWVCLTRYAQTFEYEQVMQIAALFQDRRFDTPSAENVMTTPDPDHPGAARVVWFADARTVARRAALAREAGWSIGFWRLGREDQDMWTVPQLNGATSR